MIKQAVNRVRKLSMEILETHEGVFGSNFEDNKNALSSIATITSKELKNKIAGFITKTIKREIREQQKYEEQKARDQEAAEQARAEQESSENETEEFTTIIDPPEDSPSAQ